MLFDTIPTLFQQTIGFFMDISAENPYPRFSKNELK